MLIFLTDGWGELQDGYDAIEWLASQSWANGETGVFGFSAPGWTQYLAAGAVPPHLTCCAPGGSGHSLYHHAIWTGGEFRKALVETWVNAQGKPWLIDTVCNHPNYDSAWTIVNLSERFDMANYPIFHLGGWYDICVDGQLEAFPELQARYHNQKILIGPWIHNRFGTQVQGELTYPPNAIIDPTDFFMMYLDWNNYWLNDSNNMILEPKVKFYLMGDCDTQDTTLWNFWVEADTWPLPEIEYINYYLRENALLDTLPPTITAIDTFQYDPANPCTTYGGKEYIGLTHGYGPVDQRPIEERSDVLVFSTRVLEAPLTVIGKLRFILYATSNRYDTDWTVRVTDVYPDGRSMLVTDGILMARHRHGFDIEDSLNPGMPDTFDIDLWSTAQVFNAGHQLRVIISSSNYPRFEKNPNTGAPFQRDDPNFVVATQSIYRSASLPSHLILPIYPDDPGVKETSHQNNTIEQPKIFIQSILMCAEIMFFLHKKNSVIMTLYDVCGRKQWTYNKVNCAAGEHKLTLPEMASGVYFLKCKIGDYRETNKILLIK